MATSAYWAWDRDGRPWKVARPIKAIGDRLRRYGYTVYYLGSDDTSHLQAARPLDHCPFSATGWPVPHPYPYVNAMDIMPPPAGSGLPSLQALGAQMLADKKAGHPGMAWLKYQNWEPVRDNGGPCYQDSFKPNHVQTASTDRGHIHQSGRTDLVAYAGADDYDPVARVRAPRTESAPTTEGEDDMGRQMMVADATGTVWLVDGLTRVPVADPAGAGNGQAHAESYLGNLGNGGQVGRFGTPPTAMDVWGIDVGGRLAAIEARIVAAEAADTARDTATLAAIRALTAGGTSVDTAAVINRINEVAATESTTVAALRADIATLRQRLAAAAQAEATSLTQP